MNSTLSTVSRIVKSKSLKLTAAAALFGIGLFPGSAFAVGDCDGFALSARGRRVSGDLRRNVAPHRIPAGTILQVTGRYVEFAVDLDSFTVLNYTLTGAPGRKQITPVRTVLFTSKTPQHGRVLTGSLFVDMNSEQLVLERSGPGISMKIQAKDCDQGGLFQMEPEPTTVERNRLASEYRYFARDTLSGRLFFTNGIVLGYDSPETASLIEAESGANTAVWTVADGGRIGMVVGEDADQAIAGARAMGTLIDFP